MFSFKRLLPTRPAVISRAPNMLGSSFVVADLRSQQIIACGRRLADRRDIVLRERMQTIDTREPVVVAPVHTTADADRRNPRHIDAVRECGADDVELVLDAPNSVVERTDVELALEFAAAEDRAMLGINRLPRFVFRIAVAAGIKVVAAQHASQPPVDEVVETGVVGSGLEAERADRLA